MASTQPVSPWSMPPTQPVSPSWNMPPTQPVSPSLIMPQTQPVSPSLIMPQTQPVSPSLNMPPTQPVSPSLIMPQTQPVRCDAEYLGRWRPGVAMMDGEGVIKGVVSTTIITHDHIPSPLSTTITEGMRKRARADISPSWDIERGRSILDLPMTQPVGANPSAVAAGERIDSDMDAGVVEMPSAAAAGKEG